MTVERNPVFRGEVQMVDDVTGRDTLILLNSSGNSSGDIGVYKHEVDAQGVKISRPVFGVSGANASLNLGTSLEPGVLTVDGPGGRAAFELNGHNAWLTIGAEGNEGDLRIIDAQGRLVLDFNGDDAALVIGASGNEGDLRIRDAAGRDVLSFNGANAVLTIGGSGNEGDLEIFDAMGKKVLAFSAQSSTLVIGAAENEGDLKVVDGQERTVMNFNAERAALILGASGNAGNIMVRDAQDTPIVRISGERGQLAVGNANQAGTIVVRDARGRDTIILDGASGVVTSNADLAEDFDFVDPLVDSGTVVVLDAAGKLAVSEQAYDRKVAGIVAGGQGAQPGMVLGRLPDSVNRRPVALTGRVYCKVDATFGAVDVGDLLTTSTTPGHAMKADDPARAFGSVIGKAMAPLQAGQAMIPVLVALQ